MLRGRFTFIPSCCLVGVNRRARGVEVTHHFATTVLPPGSLRRQRSAASGLPQAV